MSKNDMKIKTGQIWRRKGTDVKVVIVEYASRWDDVSYKKLKVSPNARFQKRQAAYGEYFRKHYELLVDE